MFKDLLSKLSEHADFCKHADSRIALAQSAVECWLHQPPSSCEEWNGHFTPDVEEREAWRASSACKERPSQSSVQPWHAKVSSWTCRGQLRGKQLFDDCEGWRGEPHGCCATLVGAAFPYVPAEWETDQLHVVWLKWKFRKIRIESRDGLNKLNITCNVCFWPVSDLFLTSPKCLCKVG